jgi:uncharacterized protein
MKRFLCVILAVAASLTILLTNATAEEKFPVRQGMVNDFAGVIHPDAKKEMETRVREVLKTTGTSVIVVTVPTIGDNYIQGYVNDLYRAWGIGKKGENKGVLIFVAVKERRVRIETGYGVEGILPDGKVGEIIRNDIIPQLKKNDYGTGLLNAVKSVSQVILEDAKTDTAKAKTAPAAPKKAGLGTTAIIIIIVVILGIIGLIFWAVKKFGSRSSGYASNDSYGSPTFYGAGSSSFSSGSGSSSSSDSSSDSGACEGGDSGGGGSDSDY